MDDSRLMKRWWVAMVLAAAPIASCGKCQGLSGPVPSATVKPVARYELSTTGAGRLLEESYPRDGVRIELVVRKESPGVVLDSVASARPRAGALRLAVLHDGRVELRIRAREATSKPAAPGGWHVLTSQAALDEQGGAVTVELFGGDVALWVDGKLVQRRALKTPLSGKPMYLGKHPGDPDAVASFAGQVQVPYFGPLDPKIYVKERGLKL